MNGTFRIAFRAMVVAAVTLLTGSAAMAQTSTGPTIHGNVYGGGNLAEVKGHVTVNIKAGTVENDVYGGGALANTNTEANTITGEGDEKVYPTTVNLTGGTIGNAYGGGLGQKNGINGATEDKPAYVYGDVLVNVNGTKFTQTFDTYQEGTGEGATTVQVPKTGRVFGCNNLNGSPLKTVTVHVHKTVRLDGGAHTAGEYEIAAVYGGGNEAAYEPTISGEETAENYVHTNVIIDGCDLTSIKQVYGGGNAASTPATLVTINGAFEIDEVFGGGNGNDKIKRQSGTDVSWLTNPGANVGFHAYDADSEAFDTPEERLTKKYGFGKAHVNIGGGIIHYVYGGSNAKGNVREVAVAMLERTIEDNCFKVDEAYGGGKAAPMDGSAELNLGCIPGVGTVYGGARAATVNNNVVLTITNGTFNKVFGGNNEAGTINGTITLNIEETGCTPIVIGQLYGGGNLAAYTAPTGENGPTLNIKSFTSIGEVYGGGYSADVTGNVHVNINEVVGKQAATVNGYPKDAQNQDITSLDGVAIPTHTKDAIGAIRVVYGGGYGADVIGDVEVNIGTSETIDYVSMASGETEPRTGITVEGANITNSVYGGGFGAATTVTGNVVVNVGGQKTEPTTTTFIGGDIAIGGSVYGGSALGAVNATKSGTTLSLTEGKTTAVTLCKGNVTGAVFGGGQGNSNTTAHVYGKSTVTLYGDVVAGGLYGGCDANGEMHDGAELNLFGGTVGTTLGDTDPIPNMVFGGGLGQATRVDGNVTVNVGSKDYTGNTSVTIWGNVYGGGALGDVNTPKNTSDATTYTTLVNLFKGTVNGNVFGGGLGQAAKAAEGTPNTEGYKPAVPEVAAVVKGNVRVDLNGYEGIAINDESAFGSCIVTGNIFGCNNTKGSPEGDAEVHIYKTVGTGSNVRSPENEKTNTTYELAAVFGGGNRAAYSTSGKTAKVFIETCDVSIKEVYGGGYGADVPNTQVEVKGAYEIGTVFGGGYGAGSSDPTAADYNPGANVNGSTDVILKGGVIHEVYGGSNTKGNIVVGSNVNVSDGQGCCDLKVDNIYGGGRNASMEGGTSIVLGCQPNTWIEDIYAGSREADVDGDVELTITSGKFKRVFGGNKTSGKLKGSIKVNIEETGNCGTPIIIGELYAGGNEADYSIYGYKDDGTPMTADELRTRLTTEYPGKTTAQIEELFQAAKKNEPQLNVRAFTSIGAIYGGGYSAKMYADPTVSINVVKGSHYNDDALEAGSTPALAGITPATTLPYPAHAKGAVGAIGNVFGGGNLATVYGSTTVNIGTETSVGFKTEPIHLRTNSETPLTKNTETGLYDITVEGANITGNVYGGGRLADVTGNTNVNICAKYNTTSEKWESVSYATGLAGVTIGVDGVKDKDHGNVFGGGKGIADNFYCDRAMVGINDAGADKENYPNGYPDGNTSVIIGNGTVNGSVYGGGEIGRVEMNTAVTIGIEGGTVTSTPRIKGNVFGAGKGLETHGYAALVRGNPIVTIQGNAKVDSCVYGGGEIASVARYQVVGGVPVALAGEEGNYSGYCTVKVLGNAIIGPDEKMVMHHVDAQGNTVNGSDGFPLLPDDAGHVFAAGKGVLPKIYTYTDNAHRPKRMLAYNDETISKISSGEIAYWEYSDAPTNKNIWQYFKDETQYFEFIQTLALATQTAVTVDGNAFVKGSVYGGSQNGLVQYDTHVTIDGNCQIGCGKETTDRHPDAVWDETYTVTEGTDLECASWEYDPLSGAPYDPYARYLYNGKYYYDEAHTKYAEGGSIVAKDGHTYYGNVFGGGSGSVPYFDTEKGISRYIPTAGEVKRDTYVTISGGHILTNVYGGNESTNVLGTAHVTMTGGTIGVPRTPQQIKDHPVTCYLFGAGKGDQRIFFNKETNVKDAIVSVEGGRIYGSVFGGGEDGHVLRNTEVTIGKAGGTGPNIGTVGSTYVDGNVFGGGRGFSGEALTAGNVGGSVDLIINGGTMLGSVYGGGRLASVGYGLYLVDEEVGGVKPYGVMREDNEYDGSYPNPSSEAAGTFYNNGRGHITVTVNGGTIGKEFDSDVEGEHSGNVFGGSMGRFTKLDGTPFDAANHWALLATAKSTTVNIKGGTIKRSVYGGGEMGTVTTDAIVNVSGGTIGTLGKGRAEFGNVYGGGKGYVDDAGTYATAGIIKGNTKVTINSGSNGEPKIYHNIYGGGAYGSVGTITYGAATYVPNQTAAVSNMPTAWERAAEGTTQVNTGTAEIYVYGGTIGTNGNENGMVFGSSRGDVGAPVEGVDPNNRLAWVYNTKVVIGGEGKSPIVYGSVYGSGENGHVFNNTQVDIHSGTMGVTTDDSFGGPNYRLRGNVYGGGCGEDTYPGTTGTTKEDFNPLAGIVLGTTNVMIDGGQVVHNVYGAGALGSATNTSVTIAGNAVIGVSGKNGGNVFGAARGKEGITIVGSNLANSIETAVNINGGQIWGSVYGGGETGNVKQDVNVSMTGGAVAKDVYGGGALAHTQTANWDMTNASWLTDKISTTPNGKTTTTYKTHVSLTGGTITGDAYGGALGRKEYGTKGQAGYESPVEATVFGDVLVELNNNNNGGDADGSKKGCAVTRVFGCNNLNGTPKGKVKVYVYATQKKGEANLSTKAAKNTNTYDVQAVYGGGNLAPYIPVDATLDYATNQAKVDAARPEVIIDGCDLTSIKQVYGGGNAAPVPATYVEVNRAYEIDEAFGGGNGYDNYSLKEGDATVWYQNPGANVGYYTYASYPKSGTDAGAGTEESPWTAVETPEFAGGAEHKEARLADNAAAAAIRYGSGIATLVVKGGTIHTSYGGSNSKGNVRAQLSSTYTASFDDCPMAVSQSYGGGKNAYSDAETDMVADCAKGVKEMFGGAKDADMDGDINMLITNGSSLERVFGGNNTSGAVNGSIAITLKEGGCEPIRIGELYLGGFLAPYSVYGYAKNKDGSYKTEMVDYIDGDEVKQKEQRIPLKKGDEGALATPHKDPRINVISATYIGNIFGGGYQAKLIGNPHINVNMEPGRILKEYVENTTANPFVGEHKDANNNVIYVGKEIAENGDGILEIGTIGNIYGGGNLADIVGDTYVEIGTGTVHNDNGEFVQITPARNAATITGNVFGGGKGKADSFECAKAMVGVDNESDDPNNRDGGTHVIIGNGTVKGNVYGGGEIGRVERNTEVTIGLGDGEEGGAKSPVIEGNVFGAGSGKKTHGYSALVRGNSTVTVQGNAWVQKSIYGGGETATVGKYALNDAGLPTASVRGGLCTVTVKGYAEVGPDGMQMKKAGGPDDTGYVFGACKGILPYEGYADSEKPQHMDGDRQSDGTWIDHPKAYKAFGELTLDNNNVLEVDNAYMTFINTLALATTTEVTIGGHAFIKGSVYGGSENGHVQGNTHVTIDGDCQIGNGDGVNRRYTADEWAYDGSSDDKSLKECASWDYGKKIGTDANGKDIMEYQPYDVYKDSDSDGTPDYATDGHTFYGNVFGGGSGYFSYHRNHPTALTALKAKDAGYADGLWHREAGSVGGNTVVDIKGGHILTSVYGGNECTDVTGTTTINMSGGTLGVPRTVAQIQAHPVTCYLFGAGKGDQRINFNTWTNVEKAIVNITGGHIFGSVFGGGEDGHVLGDVEMNISGDNTVIGTTGTSYVDGNIFGGGRGFSGDAQTAGTVGGNIKINIENGKMLGSVYGGGRLASVGTLFTAPEDPNYGNFMEDADGKTYGHVTINISGGTIGNGTGNSVIGDVSGNVFGGSMGRLTLLNGGTNPIWPKMAQVKSTEVNISGNALIKRTVYGGGELGTVRDNTHVTISGGQVNRDVYGGGYGSEDDDLHTIFNVKEPDGSNGYIDNTYAFTPMQFAGCVGKSTTVDVSGGYIRKSVYGGGEMASVGIMNCLVEEVTSEPGKDKIVVGQNNGKWTIYKNMRKHWDVDKEFALSWPIEFSYVPTFDGATHINITGGRIGTTTADDYGTDNGDVYGGGKGFAGDYNDYVFCANVGSTDVNINYASAATTLDPAAYMSGGDCIAGAVYGGGENGHVMGDTHVTLTNGLIGHGLYGGGSGKGTFSQKLLKIGKTAGSTNDDDYFTRDIYSITAGKVFGNTRVDMSGGYVVRNVYGGGTMGSVGKGNYAGGTDDYSATGYGENAGGNLWTSSTDGDNAWQFLNSGICTVNITGGTVGYTGTKDGLPYGNVFGGCRGEAAPNIVETPRYLYSPEFFVGYANETRVTIGAEGSTTGPRILGSVYGGGQDGHVRRDAKVTINSGEIGSTYTGDGTDLNNIEWLHSGNVYGAGSGIGKYQFDFNHDGDFDDVVNYNNGRSTVATKETDYSTSAGSVTRFTNVEVKGGTIHRNVYGGGSLSTIGAPKIGQDYLLYCKGDTESGHGEGKQTLNEVNISGGNIGDFESRAKDYGGHVFGGSRGDASLNSTTFSTSMFTKVNMGGGKVLGSIFGGGEVGIVKGSVVVNVTGGEVEADVYGGGALANTNTANPEGVTNQYTTTVNLLGGTVNDAFGGGLGQKNGMNGATSDVEAIVYGDVNLNLNGLEPADYVSSIHSSLVKNVGTTEQAYYLANDGCIITGNVFGCNNYNGTPKGHAKVHVFKTKPRSGQASGEYDVSGVFGGGNAADYVPADTEPKQSTEVIIEGCDLTSIDEVYGGGYGAASPATSVLVKGTKIINNVYGGGYGANTATYTNPGANVGYRTDKSRYGKGTGKAVVQLMAGTINNVYGGSNTLGDIRGGSSVTNVANDGSAGCCEKLTVGEIYGGGKQADMYGGAEIVLGCMPNDWIGAIYAGAENADIGGDVGLTLTSGKFERVFGGNNKGGKIDGYIEVNIEENPDCETPIIIGELYGGGNMAPYTVPAKYTENNPNYLSPRVNVRAFTSIGNIYGGGLGANATVTGNPLVNINEVAGGREYAGETRTLEDGTKVTLYERKADGKMGVIGTVFGGGNAAPVIGNPRVEIGTAAKQKMLSLQTKDADGITIHEVEKDVLGADIRGNVYGGGNNAEVTGDPKVTIGQKKTE